MRVLATYRGTVRDFRAWLAAGMPNVASLAEYRQKKKTAPRRTKEKLSTQV